LNVASDSRPPTLVAGLRCYLRDLIDRVGGRRVSRVLLLLLLSTVSESVGLLLLIPLLHLMNGDASTPALLWLLQLGLRPELGPVLFFFVGTMLLRAWLARTRDMELLSMRLAYVDALRSQLEAALAMASWPFLVRLRHAEVMHLLFDQLGRVNLGTHQMMQALSGLGLAVASLLVIALVAPAWTLALVLPFAVLVWLLRRRLALAAAMGSRFGLGQRELMSTARDFLAGLKLVKAHAIESPHLSALARRSEVLREDQLNFARHQASTRSWFEVGGALVLAVLLWAATEWGRMALPELLLLVFVFSRLLPVLRDGQLQLQQLAHMLPALHDVQSWIQCCQAASEPSVDTSTQRLSLRRSIRFESVSLHYGGEGPAVLVNVALTLPAGTTTALMGASGSGKTTLADLALGLLTPTTGAVWVDGNKLAADQTRRSWRGSVAYVAQDTYLFPGTIRENLCWLAGTRSQAEMWAALETADAADFVRELPHKLDHAVGERGEGLSGGQRQRLALARALLREPELLVLDEVTSQLDAESEERVLTALGRLRGRMTILVIAHRMAASRHADRTVMLEKGRVLSDSGAAA
jgi:ATP-binding cassette, subfamily C, bacterial